MIFKKTFLLDLFTAIIAFFLLLDTVFYFGFVQKHFYIKSLHLLTICLITVSLLYFVKKITHSKWLLKLNRVCFPILSIFSLILFCLDQYTYPNFVYGHLHLNSNNFIWLVFLSGFIYYLYQPDQAKKHIYLILPVLSVFLSRRLSLGNNFNLELTSSFTAIILNFFIWFFILTFFTSLFKKQADSIIAFLLFFFLFNLANFYKIKSWNQPINFSDIYLISNFKVFAGEFFTSGKTLYQILFALTTLSLSIFFTKKIFLIKNPKLIFRIKLFLVSSLVLNIPLTTPDTLNQITAWLKIPPSPANQLDYCRDNGILFCFYNDLQNIKTPTPQKYSQEKINQIYSELKNPNLKSDQLIKPNIIIILSEALFDPIQLSDIKLSSDPIKNIRQDQKSNFISPQFGGGTANVEFEAITGLSNYFLNGKVPYSQSIHQNLPTIFSLFRENSYTVTTIHPYLRSMYNRTSVYKHFGADKFISIENMRDYQKTGHYVSDQSFTQEIINQFNSTDQPQLIFTLSMQNHTPFEGKRFSENPITFDNSLATDDYNLLETYINGIYYSDQAYLQLKDFIKTSDKPTIIIVYGDHLPLLGTDFDLYKKLQFLPKNQSDWTPNDYQKMHTTPISVWANFSTDIKLANNLTPNFLSLEILKLANIQPKYQFKFINNLKDTDTVLTRNQTSKFSLSQLSDYELIQYDILSGKQYLLKL